MNEARGKRFFLYEPQRKKHEESKERIDTCPQTAELIRVAGLKRYKIKRREREKLSLAFRATRAISGSQIGNQR